MAVDHHEETPETGGRPAGQRAPVSRRAMLRTAAGASAAGAAGLVASGALAAIPAAAARRPAERTGHSGAATAGDRAADGPLVIHVRDARTGEMDVFEGTAHTRLRDPELAARIARASR
jgi:hypothetical protein